MCSLCSAYVCRHRLDPSSRWGRSSTRSRWGCCTEWTWKCGRCVPPPAGGSRANSQLSWHMKQRLHIKDVCIYRTGLWSPVLNLCRTGGNIYFLWLMVWKLFFLSNSQTHNISFLLPWLFAFSFWSLKKAKMTKLVFSVFLTSNALRLGITFKAILWCYILWNNFSVII